MSLSEEEALSYWRSLTSDEIPADCRRHLQKSWLQPIFQSTKDALMVKLRCYSGALKALVILFLL